MTAPRPRCSWVRPCAEAGEHRLWRKDDDGQVVEELVCTRHLAAANAFGFREPRAVLSVPELRALADALPEAAVLAVELTPDAVAVLDQLRARQ